MHKSVSTIKAPEFINLQPLDLNPLMSKCDIKVLYLGKNRNRSYISKEVATDMAKTLRGAPIVGYFKEDVEDFRDHGEEIIIDGDGVKFKSKTVPYGFVSPDSQVWFQDFDDTDDMTGEVVTRTYLMTTGYLWTGQYEEIQSVISEGRPQSMELEKKSLDGYWTNNNKDNVEFFIINDAIFEKLCILGDDVEPCFEGASVVPQEAVNTFTKIDSDFTTTLFTMMQDLKTVLEGGKKMEENLEYSVETPVDEAAAAVETGAVDSDTDFVKKDDEEEKKDNETAAEDDKKEDADGEDSDESNDSEEEPAKDEDEDEKKKFSLIEEENAQLKAENAQLKADYSLSQEELAGLQEKYSTLESSYLSYKNEIEGAKKDELINSFYMLSDEDKADVIANKDKYSLEDIEAKLSVICVRKKVSFNLDEDDNEKEEPVVTFNLESEVEELPSWVLAVKRTQNSRK